MLKGMKISPFTPPPPLPPSSSPVFLSSFTPHPSGPILLHFCCLETRILSGSGKGDENSFELKNFSFLDPFFFFAFFTKKSLPFEKFIFFMREKPTLPSRRILKTLREKNVFALDGVPKSKEHRNGFV